jgi:hypothetical protein
MPRHAIAQHQRQFVFANVEPRATNATANSLPKSQDPAGVICNDFLPSVRCLQLIAVAPR